LSAEAESEVHEEGAKRAGRFAEIAGLEVMAESIRAGNTFANLEGKNSRL